MRLRLPLAGSVVRLARAPGLALGASQARIGVVCLVASAALFGFTGTYFSARVRDLSPFAFTCISFFLATLVFGAVQSASRKRRSALPGGGTGRFLVGLNIATAVVFLSFYYALTCIEPAVVCAIEVGLSPAVVLLLGRAPSARWPQTKDLLAAILCGSGSVFLAFLQLTGATGLSSSEPVRLWTGILAALLNAVGCAFAAYYSKQLSNAGWSSTRILAHRSYFILPAAALLAGPSALREALERWELTLLMAGLGVIVPLYLLQLGIQRCRTFLVVLSCALVPVFAFLFEGLDHRIQWTWTTFLAIVLIFGASVLGALDFRHPARSTGIAPHSPAASTSDPLGESS